MIKLVRTKYYNSPFYVKMSTVKEFGLLFGLWVGVEDNKIYHSDDLIFMEI